MCHTGAYRIICICLSPWLNDTVHSGGHLPDACRPGWHTSSSYAHAHPCIRTAHATSHCSLLRTYHTADACACLRVSTQCLRVHKASASCRYSRLPPRPPCTRHRSASSRAAGRMLRRCVSSCPSPTPNASSMIYFITLMQSFASMLSVGAVNSCCVCMCARRAFACVRACVHR
jgi:hypothetical protein